MEDRFFVQKQLVVVPFGKRFHALDTVGNEPLFIHRFYKGDWDDEEGWHEAFDEWVDQLSKIDSALVPKVISKGEDEDGIYVILSRLVGIGLADLVNSGRFGVYAVREFIAGILEASRAAAEVGIIHGAYDPRRISVGVGADGKQSYLVEDFGLAFIHQKIQKEIMFLGLPPFASVGQSRGEAQDERGELFSISQMMLYCLAGGHPFSSEGLVDIGGAYDTGNVPRLADLREGLPADLVAWHETLCGVNGVSGFESFGAALEALPIVAEEEVLNVEMIAAELTAAHDLTATGAVGVVGKTKLITGAVAVKPAEELMAEAGVVVPQGMRVPEVTSRDRSAMKIGGIVVASLVGLGLIWLIISSMSSDEGDGGGGENGEWTAEQLEEMKENSIPLEGLQYAWNFDKALDSSLPDGPELVALNRERYASGKHGDALVIGLNAAYKAELTTSFYSSVYPDSTLSFWISADVQWARGPAILTDKAWNRSGQLRGWAIAGQQANIGKMQIQWNVANKSKRFDLDKWPSISSGEWHLVTIVKEGGKNWKFYYDGKLHQQISTENLGPHSNGNTLFVGTDASEQARFSSDVSIDDLYFWGRNLSDGEVRDLYEKELQYYPALNDE